MPRTKVNTRKEIPVHGKSLVQRRMSRAAVFPSIRKKQQMNELANNKRGTSIAPANQKIGHLEGR
jgi:hypothetical protein